MRRQENSEASKALVFIFLASTDTFGSAEITPDPECRDLPDMVTDINRHTSAEYQIVDG